MSASNQDPINSDVVECYICKSFAPNFSKPPPLFRGDPSNVMIIGQGPGSSEVEMGKPFAGQSGKRLNEWLINSGANPDSPRDSVYITSVIKCSFNPFSSTTYNRMASNCIRFLKRQIDYVKPDLIITLGAPAYNILSVTSHSYSEALFQIYNSSDYMFFSKFDRHYILLPWPHPSGRNRKLNNPDIISQLNDSFELVSEYF